MLQRALSHKHVRHLSKVVLWGHVTNKIQKNTELGMMLTSLRGSQIQPFRQVTNIGSRDCLKNLSFARFTGNEPGGLLVLERIFSI